MTCPKCGGKTTTTATKTEGARGIVFRYRKCQHCGLRVQTLEQVILRIRQGKTAMQYRNEPLE